MTYVDELQRQLTYGPQPTSNGVLNDNFMNRPMQFAPPPYVAPIQTAKGWIQPCDTCGPYDVGYADNGLNPNPFPVAGPGDGWDLISSYFYEPAWDNIVEDDYDLITIRHHTLNFGDGPDPNAIAAAITQGFANSGYGGTPLAIRVWHQEVFDLEVPTQFCFNGLLSSLPVFGGNCYNVPLSGQVASIHVWHTQFIYHNLIPAIIVLGIILALIVFAYIDYTQHDKFHFVPAITGVIHDFSPAGEAQAVVTAVLAVGALLFVVSALYPDFGRTLSGTVRTASGITGDTVRGGAAIRVPASSVGARR